VSNLRARVAAATKSRERLKPDLLLNASIPLPPLPEQRRIAALLTEQLAAVERGRVAAGIQATAAKLLLTALLEAAFDAAEVKRWPRRRLGEIATPVRGVTFPSGEASSVLFDGSIACLTTSGVQDVVAWESRRFVPTARTSGPD